MRAERRRLTLVWAAEPVEPAGDEPVDAALASVERQLRDAGRLAERALSGRTQPTRWYSQELRSRLLAAYASEAPR